MSRVARNFREQSTFLYGLGHSKDFEPSGEDKNFRAGANVYSVDDGDADDIIRIKQAEQAAIQKRQSALMTQQFCQHLCCAGLIGGGLAIAGAGR